MAAVKGTRPPNAGKGRTAGVPNKVTTELKNAILEAGKLSGYNKKGKDGLVGYLRRVADDDVKAFSGLLGRVLPLQVTGNDGKDLMPAAGVTFIIGQQADSENKT